MVIKGYKAFDNGLINRYGKKFELEKTYTTNGKISFGNNGNGFHFCKNIEDTLRYFDGVDGDIVIAEVTASGDIAQYEDEYNGYYNMYSARNIRIDRIVDRKELVEMFLTEIYSEERIKRFIQLFKLTEEEIKIFKEHYKNSIRIINALKYYQEGKTDVYEKALRHL